MSDVAPATVAVVGLGGASGASGIVCAIAGASTGIAGEVAAIGDADNDASKAVGSIKEAREADVGDMVLRSGGGAGGVSPRVVDAGAVDGVAAIGAVEGPPLGSL